MSQSNKKAKIAKPITNWLGYYKEVFGKEDPWFLGTDDKFYKSHYDVVDKMVGDNHEPFKKWITETNKKNCILLPSISESGIFNISILHCVFPEFEGQNWESKEAHVIGSDDLDF